MDFMAKQGHEYTKDYREFALTRLLRGPKAYNKFIFFLCMSCVCVSLQGGLEQ